MMKIFYAVAVSAIVAACFVAFPTLSQQVHASPSAQTAKSSLAERFAPLEKSVRTEASATVRTTCGQSAWPYLDAACLRTAGGSAIPQRDVRFVSADRFESATGH